MLDPVFAVELEPGRYVQLWSEELNCWVARLHRSFQSASSTAARFDAYPNARVVRFKLEEVRDDENG